MHGLATVWEKMEKQYQNKKTHYALVSCVATNHRVGTYYFFFFFFCLVCNRKRM